MSTQRSGWRSMAGTVAAASALAMLADESAAQVYPGTSWQTATPAAMGMDNTLLEQARTYALTGGGSGVIIRSGYVVKSWGSQSAVWEIKSSTKSIGSMLVGMAIDDDLLALDDTMLEHLASGGVPPSANQATGWLPDITLRQLAVHSAGFGSEPGFEPLVEEPGTAWWYSDTGADWLADVVTVALGQDLHNVLRTRVLNTIGVPTSALTWRDNQYRPTTINGIPRREFGSGISASADALARLAYLQLRNGVWNGVPLLPASFVQSVGDAQPSVAGLPNLEPSRFPGATSHIGLLWWTNADGELDNVPLDAYFSWGLFDSVILVIPSLDIVAARVGDGWRVGWDSNYSVMEPFVRPIAQSVLVPSSAPTVLPISWAHLHGAFRDQ